MELAGANVTLYDGKRNKPVGRHEAAAALLAALTSTDKETQG